MSKQKPTEQPGNHSEEFTAAIGRNFEELGSSTSDLPVVTLA